MRYAFILSVLTLSWLSPVAQTHRLDSLKRVYRNASSDRNKLSSLLLLIQYSGFINPDTCAVFISKAKILAQDLGDQSAARDVVYHHTNVLAKKDMPDSAMHLIDSVIQRNPRSRANSAVWLRFAMQKSRIYDRASEFSNAITQLYDVLNAAEDWHDTLHQIQAKTGIGWVQLETEQHQQALSWFYGALNTSADRRYLREYSALYSNIASAYNKMGMNDSAGAYIVRAINMGRETESLNYLATSLSIAADIYTDTKQPEKAEAALQEAIAIRRQIGDPYYTVYDISRLANWYAHVGRPTEGIEVCMRGIALAQQYRLPSQLQLMYHALAENYRMSGNNALYAQTLEKVIAMKDSFSSINSSNLLTKLQAKYDVQRRENTIIQQQLDLSRKNNVIYVSLGILLLAGAVAYFIRREHLRKMQLQLRQMREAQQLASEKAARHAEENERKRIASDLHDNLGTYANAVLHGTELLQKHAGGSDQQLVKNLNSASKEVLISLRETIWALKKESYTAEECLFRIRNFVMPLNRYYEEISFEVRGTAPAGMVIHYSRALHIVRMLQEAITNAIKHAAASHVTVLSEDENGQWLVKVIDDGVGFTPGILNKTDEQYGLDNLAERARVSGTMLSISSGQEKGTVVQLRVHHSENHQKQVL